MKVIGAGFGRTGTVSIYAALTELGYKVLHLKTIIQMNQLPIWRKIIRLKNTINYIQNYVLYYDDNRDRHTRSVDPGLQKYLYEQQKRKERYEAKMIHLLLKATQDYDAIVDHPGCNFYKELARLYPSATILLSVRDDKDYAQSVINTLSKMAHFFAHPVYGSSLVMWFVPNNMIDFYWVIKHFREPTAELKWSEVHLRFRFPDDMRNKEKLKECFNRHNQGVVDLFRTNSDVFLTKRLLVYKVEQGWDPLCKKLNLQIPNTTFPKLNDTKQQKSMLIGMYVIACTIILFLLGSFTALLFSKYWLSGGLILILIIFKQFMNYILIPWQIKKILKRD